jgi:hypothetical protein
VIWWYWRQESYYILFGRQSYSILKLVFIVAHCFYNAKSYLPHHAPGESRFPQIKQHFSSSEPRTVNPFQWIQQMPQQLAKETFDVHL